MLCTFGPADERKRIWILVFEDQDRLAMSFDDENEALNAFFDATVHWNCTLFSTVDVPAAR